MNEPTRMSIILPMFIFILCCHHHRWIDDDDDVDADNASDNALHIFVACLSCIVLVVFAVMSCCDNSGGNVAVVCCPGLTVSGSFYPFYKLFPR